MAGHLGSPAVLQNVIQSTRLLIHHEDPKQFVPTYASRKALKTLCRFGSILIRGISGSGKTRLGLKLLQDLSETKNRVPVVLTSYRQWHLIPKRRKQQDDHSDSDQHSTRYIVMIDNIFGSSCLVNTWVEEWSRMFDIMFPYVESGQIFLIITSRPEILSQCEHRLKKYGMLEIMNCVSLYTGDCELKRHEKRAIIRKFCGKQISFKQDEIEEILDIETSIGLPQCCKFYARSREAQTKGVQFFCKPTEYIEEEVAVLKETDPLGYLVLLLVVINGGCLVSNLFTRGTSHIKDLAKSLGDICGMSTTPSLKRIKTKAEFLCGVFLEQIQDSFHFCHQTVFDAVFPDIAKRFPDKCIEVCSAKLLVELVRTDAVKSKDKKIAFHLSKEDYGVLGKRITDFLPSDNCLEILDHPSLHHDEFVQVLFDTLIQENKLKQVLTLELPAENQFETFSAIDDILNEDPQPFIARVSLFEYNNILSHMLLKKIRLADLILERRDDTIPPELLQQLLPCAVYVNNKPICQKLIDLGAVPNETCVKALCGSPYLQENQPEHNKLILGPHIQWYLLGDNMTSLFCLAMDKGNISLVQTLCEKLNFSYFKQGLSQMLVFLLQMFWAANFRRSTRLTDKIVEYAIETILTYASEVDVDYLTWLASGHLNTVALNVILKRDVDVNRRYHGRTSLHQAVQFGGSQCVSLLLGRGADIFMIVEEDGSTVLHLAAQTRTDSSSKTRILWEHFLTKGANMQKEIIYSRLCQNDLGYGLGIRIRKLVNKRNYVWNTPLHLASRGGDTDCLKTLITAGADVDARNLNGDTSLHLAVDYEALEIVNLLIETKASVHMTNIWDSIPLNAVQNTNQDIVKVLLDAGSDVNFANGRDGSCLHIAAISGDVKTMKLLCNKGANVNIANRHGQTCLMTATAHGDLDMIKYLCDQGARTDVIDSYGQSVIHTTLMLETDTAEKLRYLLDVHHAPVDVKDEHGRSALFIAVQSGDTEIVELLRDKGYNLEQVDNHGNTLLHAACESKSKNTSELLKLLMSGKRDVTNEDSSSVITAKKLNRINEQGDTVLSLVAKNGLTCNMQFLIDKGADLNIPDHHDRTPLHYVARRGRADYIRIMLAAGADPDVTDKDGKTPLHFAAESADEDSVRFLLLKGADPYVTDSQGKSALHIAVGMRNSNNVQLLIDKGANLNLMDRQDQSPLLTATVAGNSENMKLLLEKGADPNTKNKKNTSVLHIVCSKKNSKEDVELLLAKGSSPSALDKNKRTPLHIAAESGNTECIDLLLKSGADLCAVDKDGLMALHVAAENNHRDFLRILIDKGANVHAVKRWGKSALHLAAENSADCVSILLDNGVDPNITDSRGKIPLFYALNSGTCSVKLLLEKGSNPCSKDRMGKSLIHVAAGTSHLGSEFVRLLLDRGASPHVADTEGRTPLHMACLSGSSESVKFLLDAGADPNVFDQHKRTPLLIAAKGTHNETVKMLLEAGGDPNLCDKEGKSPLHFASNVGSSISVQLLLDKGADPSASDVKSWTPLHFAAGRATKDITTLLLQKGANTHALNVRRESALHIAAANEDSSIVKLLLGSGADPNELDFEGKSSLHIAISTGNIYSVKLLLDSGADPCLVNHKAKTPLHLAAEKRTSDIVQFLLHKDVDTNFQDDEIRTPLHIAAELGNGENVELLLFSGADPRLQDNQGSTPLHLTLAALAKVQELAAKQSSNYLSTLISLVQYGADVSVIDWQGISPLDMLHLLKRNCHDAVDGHLSRRYVLQNEKYIGIWEHANIMLSKKLDCEDKVGMEQFIQLVTGIFHGTDTIIRQLSYL